MRGIYWRYFSVHGAAAPQQRKLVHELRYQVYCVENPFEDPADHSNGLEIDHFDAHSVHALLIHRPTGLAAGTVRIVLPLTEHADESFAIQAVCDKALLSAYAKVPLSTTGEISRFCIAKTFRRRVQDRSYRTVPSNTEISAADERRVIPNMTLGLIQWLVETSQARGITHWYAVMEPQLLRLLARLGIHFERIGDLVDYHGWRQPCVIEVDRMLGQVHRERPDVWSVIANPALIGDPSADQAS
ncbi:MAG: PEP-CTERM/exosortase system-associated acyltransferase [Alphaproteobacteria bacterium]